VIGIDNDMRARFFGAEASIAGNLARLGADVPRYRHETLDIRDREGVERLFARHGKAIGAVIHAAAQPSHDWAAREPHTDFGVNAVGTLNLLEAARAHAPEAPFVFCSTNKVYGDTPNRLPLVEQATRYAVSPEHRFSANGIDESMSIDTTLHSLFGASKAAADLLVQEYGRYFGMPTVAFRGGCLTGPAHAGAELHGFLAYLVRACAEGRPYRVFGYKAKQVRDNLHARDLVEAFWCFVQAPRPGEAYNIGGGTHSNCSMLEAIALAERHVGRGLDWSYEERARLGDHIWWISDTGKFRAHYPHWRVTRDCDAIVAEIADALRPRA
jgi:CDP-paratose 2-epimerase